MILTLRIVDANGVVLYEECLVEGVGVVPRVGDAVLVEPNEGFVKTVIWDYSIGMVTVYLD